jgi:hypothetical protein
MVVWEGEAQKGGFGGGTLVTRGRPCPLAPHYRQPSAWVVCGALRHSVNRHSSPVILVTPLRHGKRPQVGTVGASHSAGIAPPLLRGMMDSITHRGKGGQDAEEGPHGWIT